MEQQWPVEKIIRKIKVRGVSYYEIKYEGYEETSERSYKEMMEDCPGLVKEYHERRLVGWDVKQILDVKFDVNGKATHFLIHWDDHPIKESSWVEASDVGELSKREFFETREYIANLRKTKAVINANSSTGQQAARGQSSSSIPSTSGSSGSSNVASSRTPRAQKPGTSNVVSSKTSRAKKHDNGQTTSTHRTVSQNSQQSSSSSNGQPATGSRGSPSTSNAASSKASRGQKRDRVQTTSTSPPVPQKQPISSRNGRNVTRSAPVAHGSQSVEHNVQSTSSSGNTNRSFYDSLPVTEKFKELPTYFQDRAYDFKVIEIKSCHVIPKKGRQYVCEIQYTTDTQEFRLSEAFLAKNYRPELAQFEGISGYEST